MPQPRRPSRGVLGDAVAERPVLPLDLDQADRDVLTAQAHLRREAIGDRLVERLFLFDGPALVPSDLDDRQVFAAADVEVVQVEDEVLRTPTPTSATCTTRVIASR